MCVEYENHTICVESPQWIFLGSMEEESDFIHKVW